MTIRVPARRDSFSVRMQKTKEATEGLTQIKWQRVKARQAVLYACDRLEKLFSGVNRNICSDCRRAVPGSVVAGSLCRAFASKEAGCCNACSLTGGYNSHERFKLVRNHFRFDGKYGFFDPREHRCSLPRFWRSDSCLFYMCSSVADKLTKKQLAEINAFVSLIIAYRAAWEYPDYFQ